MEQMPGNKRTIQLAHIKRGIVRVIGVFAYRERVPLCSSSYTAQRGLRRKDPPYMYAM